MPHLVLDIFPLVLSLVQQLVLLLELILQEPFSRGALHLSFRDQRSEPALLLLDLAELDFELFVL